MRYNGIPRSLFWCLHGVVGWLSQCEAGEGGWFRPLRLGKRRRLTVALCVDTVLSIKIASGMPESAFLLTNVDTLMPASAKFSTLLTLSRMKASDGGSTCESETAWLYQGNASIEARRKATPLQRRSALEESSRGSVGVSSVNVAHSSPEEEESRSVRDNAVKRRGRQNWSKIVNLIGQRHATTSMDFCLRVTPPLSNQAFHTTNEGGEYADQILLKVGEPGENKAFLTNFW